MRVKGKRENFEHMYPLVMWMIFIYSDIKKIPKINMASNPLIVRSCCALEENKLL
jgi:hypothetical protein